MSEMIVQVRNKMLRRIGGVNHFVSRNKDYTIQFQFDESWDNVRTKMAVFAYEDGEYGSEIFDGDTCNVPEFPREGRILIGVKAGEDLSTELLCIPVCKSADDVITDEYDEPDPKIYEQILDIINNLWNGGTTVYPSPVKFLASPSTAKVGDLIRVKEVDENGDVTRTEGFDVGVELAEKIDAPQVAQVGEVLTVEEVNEDGKPIKWKTSPAAAKQKQADWAQNDDTATDYVKNRPGGYYGELVTVDEEIYSGEINDVRMDIDTDAGFTLVIGQAYKVTIGDAEKTYTAFADSFRGIDCVIIGDGKIAEVLESSEMFGLVYAAIEGKGSEAMVVCPVADVGKTIRITTETQKREVHKIPAELIDLGGVNESIKQTNAVLDELSDQYASEISAINNILTVGPITFKRGNRTLALGKYDANNGLILRWDNVNDRYTMLSENGLVVKYSDVGLYATTYNMSLVEKKHNSGIRFKLERSDINGGTRFVLDNVAGDTTTFYASGKIVNSNKLLQLSASSTITEDNATTLRGVKTPEQEYDAANKKYVDQRLPSPATAQVGQIIKVKAVDSAGKPTAWEAVDMPEEIEWVNATLTYDDNGNSSISTDISATEVIRRIKEGRCCVVRLTDVDYKLTMLQSFCDEIGANFITTLNNIIYTLVFSIDNGSDYVYLNKSSIGSMLFDLERNSDDPTKATFIDGTTVSDVYEAVGQNTPVYLRIGENVYSWSGSASNDRFSTIIEDGNELKYSRITLGGDGNPHSTNATIYEKVL